ncbi:ATP-dependent helicase HepA [Aquisphaera giovannonii]|uniref:ATP-dependent helicase HepA n=1 Tax=Aquisphaera giovannonii TaxID=406548 RepID=A0A5B9W4W3_9BACT|nr:DEAD/DEAH box helicase [Aquisphaera giovannonii]QEH35307.1 ATP-dependent helicase HepA [Aquisphaera giovannonii]
MPLELTLSPQGHLHTRESSSPDAVGLDGPAAARAKEAFEEGTARGLLHLATAELEASLPAPFAFARGLARDYLSRLCQAPAEGGEAAMAAPIPPPAESDLAFRALQAPPMPGAEYLDAAALAGWWAELDELVRREIRDRKGDAQAYFSALNPQWRLVGRVTFHLAENKRDPDYPFAFLATYIPGLSARGRARHEPLGKALKEYAGAKDREALLNLLQPIQRASERSRLVKGLVDSGEVYHPLAWTPREAYDFLRDIPTLEESGLVVRVPDWWKAKHPPRPAVSVKIDARKGTKIDVDSLLTFSMGVTIDGEPLSEGELRDILESDGGLVPLKGKWVEVDREKLREALDHWKEVEREAREGGLTFYQGMRLLSGLPLEKGEEGSPAAEAREWVGLSAGPALEETLRALRSPEAMGAAAPPGLHATLRPYQQTGVNWLRFVTGLGLGACLADDMGLGKTVQVIGLLLERKAAREARAADANGNGKAKAAPPPAPAPSLLVVPASLLANWKAELDRFAPGISFAIVHPSEQAANKGKGDDPGPRAIEGRDLAITSYGMLSRAAWLKERAWDLVILDEAQAIKNSGTRQSRGAKALKAKARVALTGTPVENRLSDLWSLFDFLNPGLLGDSKTFSKLSKQMESSSSYGPLRRLVGPYILRRLKTDKRVIADLPEKVEVSAFCGLGREQAALYEKAVRELEQGLEESGAEIARRGLILAQLMRLKQICNHPAQVLGADDYDPEKSGKFRRLAEICEEIAGRQEKVLVFSQFREINGPLARYLETIFGRPGLTLHGGTPVAQRRRLVENFQREDGPPFFVLSLKAGGTGLNLTAASHVIHFDRWWNPAVENQATDRAFRIGQRRNVLVHKFVCRGTVEERIDAVIAEKQGLADEVVGTEGAEARLTEMTDAQLLDFVRLDARKALKT